MFISHRNCSLAVCLYFFRKNTQPKFNDIKKLSENLSMNPESLMEKLLKCYNITPYEIENLVQKKGNNYFCKRCKYKSDEKCNVKRHVHTHIKDIFYTFICDICDKTFKTQNCRNSHKSKQHKNNQ